MDDSEGATPENDSRASEQHALRGLDEVDFDQRLKRRRMTRVHPVIPDEWFAPASSECRELYVDGHYYGCICLCQAVAEGLAKFLLATNQLDERGSQSERCRRLEDAGIISPVCRTAFMCIRGEDRNAFHHLNRDIAQDAAVLEARAEECVDCLYAIENAVFAFESDAGGIRPRNPKYWIIEGQMAKVFLRMQ